MFQPQKKLFIVSMPFLWGNKFNQVTVFQSGIMKSIRPGNYIYTVKLFPYLLYFSLLFFFGCKKENGLISQRQSPKETSTEFVEYTINKGQQYCNQTTFLPIKYSELKFKVKFDSTAIYTSVRQENQSDISKLYGFSDNDSAHHEFSARFGWRWSNNALWLFGYTYNKGIRAFKALGTVNIGTENYCSIKVDSSSYLFTLNDVSDTMVRKSITSQAVGYKLYPYFGGDELAPHDINIWIKELP